MRHSTLIAFSTLILVSVACGGSSTPVETPGNTPTSPTEALESPSIVPTETPDSASTSPTRAPESVSTAPTETPEVEVIIASLEEMPYVELLGLIPDRFDTRGKIYINNYALARELFNIPLPEPEADADALLRYYVHLTVSPEHYASLDFSPISDVGSSEMIEGPFISGHNIRLLSGLEGFGEYLSFDLRNIDQAIEAVTPPGSLEIVRGRIDPAAVDRALRACVECPSPVIKEHQGTQFYSWGRDLLIVGASYGPPALDSLGRGGRIAVQDQYAFRTTNTEHMQALISASMGRHPSLADAEEFRLLGEGMAELGAYSMLLGEFTQNLQETLRGWWNPAKEKERAEQTPLRPYLTVATGLGKDKGGKYMALVLVHENAELASENVGQLRQRIEQGWSLFNQQPWAELVDSMEIRSEGLTLLAKIRGSITHSQQWLRWWYFNDPLLGHE